MEHTKLPWTYRGTMNGNTLYLVADLPEPALSLAMNGGPGYIAELTAPNVGAVEANEPSFVSANAAFIVRACNAHYDIVAALEDLMACHSDYAERDKHEMKAAHDAIAKAKGEV